MDLMSNPKKKGANVDLMVSYPELNLGFAVEITGTRDIVKKDSKKIAQSWQFISERVGTSNENDKMIIVANTQCHLDPESRKTEGFSADIVKLLSNNGVLLITSFQLYQQWMAIQQGSLSASDLAQKLHSSSGLFL